MQEPRFMKPSPLQIKRQQMRPTIPLALQDLSQLCLQPLEKTKSALPVLQKLFPKTFSQKACRIAKGRGKEGRMLRVGVVFSGGQAAGGHNVVAALYDGLKEIHPDSQLIGFLEGPEGIVSNRAKLLSEEEIAPYRNQGGFDLLGSGRTKIETEQQLEAAWEAVRSRNLEGLVVIGGDDSNTNAAVLAEFFLSKGSSISVIGIPKTIDGDLRSEEIELSFGFDSACKTYAQIIGNIARDCLSAKKYYHFIKLMGRSASHITLECALATHPNLAFIGEERKTLSDIVQEIVDLICERSKIGKEYGVILIPEGLIEFIPEIQTLIQEINQLLVDHAAQQVTEKLSAPSKKTFLSLPEKMQKQLVLERDSHGNVQVSQITTEQLLMELVRKELKNRKDYQGKFNAQEHFLGYEGRACMPSVFDSNYTYTLGRMAALAIREGVTGMVASVQNLKNSIDQWQFTLLPIVQLMHMEVRKGKEKPVIRKALVDINQEPFVYFSRIRKAWSLQDAYRYPGPMQFFEEIDSTDQIPFILGS